MSVNLESFREDLNKIIDNSVNIDANEKAVLRNLFGKLTDYTETHINGIRDMVREQIEPPEIDFEVRTILADKVMKENFISQRSYCPVIPENEDDTENNRYFGVFFDCNYEKFREICSESAYRVKVTLRDTEKPVESTCRLVPDSVYVQYEEILYRTARQYGIKRPLIFSPYARKFALIKMRNVGFSTEDISDIEIIDIDEKYMPTTKYTLMWNVLVEDTDEYARIGNCPDNIKVSPDFNSMYYKRFFPDTPHNVYYVFHFSNTEKFCTVRTENTLYIASDIDLMTVGYEKVTLLKDIEDTACYRNYYRPNSFSCMRVRSQADIIYTLNSFNNNPYGIVIDEDVKVVNDSKKIPENLKRFRNYNAEVSYYTDVVMDRITYESIARSHRLRSSLYCIVKFTGGEICEDYANYVTEYLNETYSEFNWIGVSGNGLDMAGLLD